MIEKCERYVESLSVIKLDKAKRQGPGSRSFYRNDGLGVKCHHSETQMKTELMPESSSASCFDPVRQEFNALNRLQLFFLQSVFVCAFSDLTTITQKQQIELCNADTFFLSSLICIFITSSSCAQGTFQSRINARNGMRPPRLN